MGWVVVVMTQQYLAGELSLFLARLQAVAASPEASSHAVRLRHEAETETVAALGSVIVRALELTDGLCWDSLRRGDIAAFARQAVIGAELREFGVCACLLGGG